MDIHIRPEKKEDRQAVFELIEQAFRNEEYSDHKEHFLVDRLRASKAFVPELSLVCEYKNTLVGYILLTEVKITTTATEVTSLALAPVAVLPEYQGRGIGGKLIHAAHGMAEKLGYGSVIVLGHAHYYPRFGYRPAHLFHITLPYDVPKENCMAKELKPDALHNVQGMVVYSEEFSA